MYVVLIKENTTNLREHSSVGRDIA